MKRKVRRVSAVTRSNRPPFLFLSFQTIVKSFRKGNKRIRGEVEDVYSDRDGPGSLSLSRPGLSLSGIIVRCGPVVFLGVVRDTSRTSPMVNIRGH